MKKQSSILYLDEASEEIKSILEELKPNGFSLFYFEEIEQEKRDELLKNVDYIMVAMKKLDKVMLEKAANLKFVQKTGIGVDNIDIEAAKNLRIPVANTPGANAVGVAELTILLTLALNRKIMLANEATKSGKWISWDLRPHSFEMRGKKHGIIGMGNIGKEVAKLSKAFGTELMYYDAVRLSGTQEQEIGVVYTSLSELLSQSDIVSIHIPLLKDTKGLIGLEQLQLMKKNAVLINVARGGIVDEKALYRVLSDGLIAGAGIDVWEEEPIKKNNPLLALNNLIATPHIGAGTKDTIKRVLSMAYNNIIDVSNGNKPKYIVNEIDEARQ